MARILVVDDNAMMRSVMRIALQRAGHDVTIAEDGTRALAAFGTGGSFDLIITDMEMPRLDGRGLVEALRRATCASPVLVISGRYGESELARMAAGESPSVQGSLEKPFTAERLISKVSEMLG
jgi:CheY-like chemotaxis protein